MSLKYSDFLFQPLRNNKIKLKKKVKYKDIIIPENFVSDGASVPYIAKFFNFVRYRMDYLPCAVIHDYLCDLQQYDKADEYFKECLKDLQINKITIFLFYYAVRIYHIIKYKFLKRLKSERKI